MARYGTSAYGMSAYGPDHPYLDVPGKIIWTIQVDWTRSGTFDNMEPQTQKKISFRAGRKGRMRTSGDGQESPGQETFRFEIYDPTGRYDSFNTASPIYDYLGALGMAVRVMAMSTTTLAAAEPVFYGVLTGLNYDAKTHRAVLTGKGMAQWLKEVPVWTPCQPVTGGHDAYFVADGSTPFPVNYWRGRPNGLSLRECVDITLARAAWPYGAYHGDAVTNSEQPDYFYLDGSSAWKALEELVDGFMARMFFLRDGRLFMMNRADVFGTNSAAAAPTGAQESFGLERPNAFESLRNTVKVNVRPHAVTPFLAPYIASYYKEVWSQAGPFEVAPLTTIELDVKYNAEAPSEGSFVDVNGSGYPVNYEAWSAANRTGTRMDAAGSGQGEFTVEWETTGGLQYPYGNNQQWTRVKFRNYSAVLTAYFFDAKVMLIGIRETGAPMVSQAVDAASVALNGARTLNINSRWIQTAGMGAAIAQSYVDALSTREKATPATLMYQWSGDLLYQNLLIYDVGAHVQFGTQGSSTSLDNFGMWGRWLIVGREVDWISPDGQDAWVKLTFERGNADVVSPVHERSTSANSGAVPAGSVSVSHQVDNRPCRLLVTLVSVRAYQSVSSVTRGSQSFTKYGEAQAGTGNNPRVEMWYLLAPTVGTATVTVTLSGADFVEVANIGFYNVHQGTPLGPVATGSAGSGAPSVNVAAASGDIVLDAVGYAGTSAVVGPGQTSIGTITSDGSWKLSASKEIGAASVTMSWTLATAWAQVAAAIKAASG